MLLFWVHPHRKLHTRNKKKLDAGNKAFTYILFKNACNSSGSVKKKDPIKDFQCISYNVTDDAQLQLICDELQKQLGDDFIVFRPKTYKTCIMIINKNTENVENINQNEYYLPRVLCKDFI